MGGTPVSVFVADDHPLYRASLTRTIQSRPDFKVCGEAANGRDALQGILELRPDVAVLDMKMPGLSGSEVLNAIQRDDLPTRVIFLSGELEPEIVYRAMADGAAGYLSKTSEPDIICEAISGAHRGEVVLSPELQAGLAGEIRIRETTDRPALTPREQEILKMTAAGHSGPEIGQLLHLSPATVKTHLQHVYEKLGVSDRAAAVAEAMRRGLME